MNLLSKRDYNPQAKSGKAAQIRQLILKDSTDLKYSAKRIA